MQVALQLQIVGRIGEDKVDAALGQAPHHLDAFAGMDNVELQRIVSASSIGVHLVRHPGFVGPRESMIQN